MATASKPTIVRRLVMWNMVTLDDLPKTCGWKTKEMAGGTPQQGEQDASAAQRPDAVEIQLCLRRSCISWRTKTIP